ncbi:MAG: polysaccharide pyruvyl transferase family protein, partial [Bacillota bacterium]|nr:polysaccharide pyruvyl transferase family protein [Bacillota bacterium]
MGCINNEQHFMLFAHNGSNNHGCEALLRTITEQIKSEFEQSRISLCSFHPDEDQNANVSNINKYINHYDTVKRHSFDHIAAAINRRTVNNPYFNYSIMQKHIIKEAQNNDVCISIGGDVYCYKKPYIYYTIDSHIKKAGKKLVLWGCSVERDAFDEDMKKDFERFDLIMPRESITTELLTEKLGSNKIKPITDPAFLMQPEFLPLPENFEKGNMIGINVSPLSAGYEKVNGMTLRSVHALINHIIKNTGHNIALIPHVVRDPLGDMQCLTEL